MASIGGRGFHPNADRINMNIDSGASDDLVSDKPILRLRDRVRDYSKLTERKTIVTAGNMQVFATATGTKWGYILDQAKRRVPSRISVVIVPGLGRNLFSVKAMNLGESIILETGNSRLQLNRNASLLMNQHPEDKGLSSYEVFIHALRGMIEVIPTTPQQNGVSERDGKTPATKNRCLLRRGDNTSEEATVTETKRQHAQIHDSTSEDATVTKLEH